MLEKIKKLYNECKPGYRKYADKLQSVIEESKKYGEIDPAFRTDFIQIIEEVKKLKEVWEKWKPLWVRKNDWREFKELYNEIYLCDKCDLDLIRKNKSRLKVPGAFSEKETSLPVMVISEAPGYYEETTSWTFNKLEFGYPVQGKQGTVFQKMCDVAGVNRYDLFITNLLKCSDKNEEVKNIIVDVSECYGHCYSYLEKQILLYKPVIIWTLGLSALSFVKKFLYNLSQEDLEGNEAVEFSYGKNSKTIIVTPKYFIINNAHPSYISMKEEDYWFIRKERATIELIKLIINIFKEEVDE